MSFIDSISNLFGKKVVVADAKEYLNNKSNAIRIGNSFNLSTPETCSSVYTSINIIAGTISKLPIGIYKKTDNGKVLYTDHKWFNTIKYNPDGRLSTSKWLSFALTQMYLQGNSFFLKSDFDDNLNANVKSLKPLPELEKVTFYEGDYWYKFKNIKNWLPSKELIHFYLISKDGGITGLNPIEAIKTELAIQSGGETALKNHYQNGMLSTLYLEADLEGAGLADKQKAKEYFEQLQVDFQGYQNTGKIPRIPPMYKLKSLPSNQIDFLVNSKYTINQIAALFQIPSNMLGVNEGANYGKAEEQGLAFKNITLSNICNIIKSELEAKILTVQERNEGVSIDFDFSKLYDIDLTTRANVAKTLHSMGVLSPNEVREQFSLEKIDNDNLNYHYQQMQVIPIELTDYVNYKPVQTTPPATGDDNNKIKE
jgi:HK97 family phage portal protein